MIDYKVTRENNIATLQRINKHGEKLDLLQVITATDGRVVIVNKYYHDSLRFKCDTGIKFIKSGNNYIAKINSELQVFKLPHYIELHNEILNSNRAMLHLSTSKIISDNVKENMVLDDRGIVDNMLECIANI